MDLVFHFQRFQKTIYIKTTMYLKVSTVMIVVKVLLFINIKETSIFEPLY